MTIEVIRQGDVPSDRTYDAECRRCLSLLRFTSRDARLIPDDRDGDYLEITCPVCGGKVTKAHQVQQ